MSTECRAGLYGENCAHTCGYCANDAVCDHVTGNACPGERCELGYEGAGCQQG